MPSAQIVHRWHWKLSDLAVGTQYEFMELAVGTQWGS